MNTDTLPRRRMRLPQLSKANRRARRHGPASEFVLMAQAVEMKRRPQWDRSE